MKVKFEKNMFELVPESYFETKELSLMWNLISDSEKFNQKLVSMGKFIPGKNDSSRFDVKK